jgi:hypothetical protein
LSGLIRKEVDVAERTSRKAATAASRTLKTKSSSRAAKTAAGSALSQRGGKKVTRKKAASAAGKALKAPGASSTAKIAAASALTQKPSAKKAGAKKAKTGTPTKKNFEPKIKTKTGVGLYAKRAPAKKAPAKRK